MDEIYVETEVSRIATRVLALLAPSAEHATVLCLQGDLGAGKTTLTGALAKELGVEETVVSPTFVIAKFYSPTRGAFQSLAHLDAYRIEDDRELGPIGFEALLREPNTLVIIEWPERIKKSIPLHATWMNITHRDTTRHITTV